MLRHEHGLVYLDRYHRLERQVCRRPARAAPPSRRPRSTRRALDEALPVEADAGRAREPLQRRAGGRRGARPCRQWTTVHHRRSRHRQDHHGRAAAGAARRPGQRDRPLSIALSAPTGKAAARLPGGRERRAAPAGGRPGRVGRPEAMTLHRLLGWRPDNTTRFRHDRGNRLKYDVVVRRRVLDGRPHDDGPAARGGPAADPAGAGRRPAPAHLGRRRARCCPTWSAATRAARLAGPVALTAQLPLRRRHPGGRRGAARRGDADAVLAALRSGSAEVEFVETDDPAAGPAGAAARARRWRSGRRRWPATPRPRSRRSTTTGCSAPTARDRTAYATGTGRSSSGSARRPASRSTVRLVRRPAAARHRQRLRARDLQRRDRRGRAAHGGRLRARIARRRHGSPTSRPGGSTRSRPCTR